MFISPNIQNHKMNSSDVFQRKKLNLQALVFLVSSVEPQEAKGLHSPILTWYKMTLNFSMLILSQNKVKWELLQVELCTGDVAGSQGDSPGITRSHVGKWLKRHWSRSHKAWACRSEIVMFIEKDSLTLWHRTLREERGRAYLPHKLRSYFMY